MNDTFAEKAKMWDSNPQVMALADLFSAELNKIVPDHSGLAILEFGCGTGLVGLRYAEKAASLDMVDASPAMLDVLRDKNEARASHVTVHEGTLSMLARQATAPKSVDWIISNVALQTIVQGWRCHNGHHGWGDAVSTRFGKKNGRRPHYQH